MKNTRGGISKKSMMLNDATPNIEVDAETYEVRADGELLTCEPAKSLPMTQRYFLVLTVIPASGLSPRGRGPGATATESRCRCPSVPDIRSANSGMTECKESTC